MARKGSKPGPKIEHMDDPGLVTAADINTVNTAIPCEFCEHLYERLAPRDVPSMKPLVTKALVWRALCENGHECVRGGTVLFACSKHALHIMKVGMGCPSCGDPKRLRPYSHTFERTITI